jgi:alcohol dehydrogenase/propanol-preferring alcohol dehydrogenase
MRAWAVTKVGQPLEEIELPTPEPAGEQVLLEVTHCGVCHSDLHIWEGGFDLGSRGMLRIEERGVKLPLAMGHEIVGRVVKWGPAAQGLAVGEQRIVYPWAGCGTCALCRSGQDNLCLTPRSLGIFQNGGYATHVLAASPRHLVAFDGLDPALAATYACSGITVLSAVRKVMPLPPEEPIVVVGAGGLGLSAIGVLRALGHAAIVVVDVAEAKLAAARAAGASATVLAEGEATTKRIIEACGAAPLAIIDLVNGSASARFAFDALRKGGRLVQVGLFGGELALPLPLMANKALTLQGSYVGTPADLRDVVRLAQSGALPAIPVERVPQHQAGAALNRLRAGGVTGRLVLEAG